MGGRLRARVGAVMVILAALLTIGASPAAPADQFTFVQVQRVNQLRLQYGTDTFAPANAFGTAISGSIAQSQMTDALDAGVNDGSVSLLLEMPGLADLSGTDNPSFNVGVVGATPVFAAGNPATYDGSADLDWWYTPSAADLQPDGSAIQQLPATFTAKKFSVAPAALSLNLVLFGAPTTLSMSSTKIEAQAGAASAPLKSTNGFAPGHEPAEGLPDSLTSFESMSGGKLAGRLSARSLYNAQIPAGLQGTNCGNFYGAANTMLDLLVSGCKAGGFLTEVTATQPDTVGTGASGAYTFTVDGNHNVTGCTHDAVTATLSDCLDAAAYSIYFQFTTDRVIDRNQVTYPQYALTVSKSGSGAGSVASAPAGIDCGSDCSEGYGWGTQVALTATAATGSTFAGWSGAGCSGTGVCNVTMDAAETVTATFTAADTGTNGGSGGTASGSGGSTPPPSGSTPPPSAGPPTPTGADTTAPALTSATISPRKMRRSATVKFTLSEAARVTFAFERVMPGRRVGNKCVAAKRANARKPGCKRFVAVGRLAAAAPAGANAKTFTTRLGKRKLKPGSYRLTLVAKDGAGNQSLPKRLSFVVVRP